MRFRSVLRMPAGLRRDARRASNQRNAVHGHDAAIERAKFGEGDRSLSVLSLWTRLPPGRATWSVVDDVRPSGAQQLQHNEVVGLVGDRDARALRCLDL